MVQKGCHSLLGLAMVTAFLQGCATVDDFSTRVTHYNVAAERVQDNGILLNILRASERRPLSFTELQSVTSSGTPSGSIGLNLPLSQNGGTTASALAPTLALSGGPTVSVNYMDTAEFYQGLLRPIPLSTVDLFVRRGLPRDVLFNLLFYQVVVERHSHANKTPPLTLTATNYVADASRLEDFQRLIEQLLNDGLSTGSIPDTSTPQGPLLTASELISSDFAAKGLAAGLKVESTSWCEASASERVDLTQRLNLSGTATKAADEACESKDTVDPRSSEPGPLPPATGGNASPLARSRLPSLFYRLVRTSDAPSFHLCFDRRSGDENPSVTYCDRYAGEATPRPNGKALAIPLNTPAKSGDPLCATLNGMVIKANAVASARPQPGFDCASATWNTGLNWSFVPYSTYGVIYHLGEVIRARQPILVKVGPADHDIPPDCPADREVASGAQPYSCRALFVVTTGAGKTGFPSVVYDGAVRSVPPGGAAGESELVLDLVNELLALNKSAKDQPTSNVFTVVGTP
jgi:hypothetical protein